MKQRLKRWFPLYALKNVSILTIGKFFLYFGGFLYGVFSAWFLGADGFGQLVLIISVVQLIKIPFNIPLGAPLLKLVRTRLANKSTLRCRDYTITCFTISLITAFSFGLLFLIFLLLAAPWFRLFNDWQTALGLYGLSEAIYLARKPTSNLLDAYERYGWHAIFMFLNTLCKDILTVVFMYFGGILGACLGYLAGEILLTLFTGVAAFRIWGCTVYKSLLDRSVEFKKASYELYLNTRSAYLASLLGTPYQKIVQLLIGNFVSPAGVGYYNIAFKFDKIFTFLAAPIQTYLFPRLVGKWAKTDDKEFFYTLRKYFYQLGPAYLLLAILIGGLSPWLIPFLYSPEFTPAIPLVFIFLPAFVFSKLSGIFNNITFVIGQQRALVTEAGLKLLIGIPAAFLLTYLFGYIGAAAAYLFIFLIVAIYRTYFFYLHFGWRWLKC